MIDKDTDLVSAMKEYGITVKDLSKEEYRSLTKDNNYLNKLLDAYNKLAEAASKAGVEFKKLRNETTYEKLGKTQAFDSQSNRSYKQISNNEKIALSGVSQFGGNAYWDELAIKIKAANDVLKQTVADQEYYKSELAKTPKDQVAMIQQWEDKLSDLDVKYAETNKKIKDYTYDMSSKTKEFWAGTLGDLIVEQKDFGSVISSIWKKIAVEAINSMMGIKQASSILSTIGGKGKKGSAGLGVSGVASSSSVLRNSVANSLFKSTFHNGGVIPKFHSGGVVPYLKNNETPAILEQGEEVNSKNERRTIEMLTEAMKVMAGNQGSSNIQIYAMDSKSFIEFADSHGDALVNIIRKQGSMGNKL